MSSTKKITIILIVVLVILTLGFLVASLYQPSSSKSFSLSPSTKQADLPLPTPTPDPLRPINITLAGYAGPGHDGGNLTDTIILAHINPRTESIHLISIPRDTWIHLPTSNEASTSSKINAAFPIGNDDLRYPNKPPQYSGDHGGGYLLMQAINQITNLDPHYYLAINFTGFINTLNLLGDIQVKAPYTFDDYFYPIKGKEDDSCDKSEEEITSLTATMAAHLLEKEFPCRYEHIHYSQGNQTMTPESALKFVRSRHSSIGGGDFGRSLRQQALIKGVRDKILSITTITKIIPLTTQALRFIQTDLDFDMIKNFLTQFQNVPNYTIYTISLNTDNVLSESISSDGQYILIPKSTAQDYSLIHQFITDQIASNSATRKN